MIVFLALMIAGLIGAVLFLGYQLDRLIRRLSDPRPLAVEQIRVSLAPSTSLSELIGEINAGFEGVVAAVKSIDAEMALCAYGLTDTLPARLDQVCGFINGHAGLITDRLNGIDGTLDVHGLAMVATLDEQGSALAKRMEQGYTVIAELPRLEEVIKPVSSSGRARLREFHLDSRVCDRCRPDYDVFERPDGSITSDPNLENTVVPCRHFGARASEAGHLKCETRTIQLPVPNGALSLEEDPEAVAETEAGWDMLKRHLQ